MSAGLPSGSGNSAKSVEAEAAVKMATERIDMN